MMLALMLAIPMTPHPAEQQACLPEGLVAGTAAAGREGVDQTAEQERSDKSSAGERNVGRNQRQHAAALGRQQVYDPGIQPHEVHGGQRHRA